MEQDIKTDDHKEFIKLIIAKCNSFTPYGELYISIKDKDDEEEILVSGECFYTEDAGGTRIISVKLRGAFLDMHNNPCVDRVYLIPIFSENGMKDSAGIFDLLKAMSSIHTQFEDAIFNVKLFETYNNNSDDRIDFTFEIDDFNPETILKTIVSGYTDKRYNSFEWKISIGDSTLYYHVFAYIFCLDGYYMYAIRGNDCDSEIDGAMFNITLMDKSILSDKIASEFNRVTKSICSWVKLTKKMYRSLRKENCKAEIICSNKTV